MGWHLHLNDSVWTAQYNRTAQPKLRVLQTVAVQTDPLNTTRSCNALNIPSFGDAMNMGLLQPARQFQAPAAPHPSNPIGCADQR